MTCLPGVSKVAKTSVGSKAECVGVRLYESLPCCLDFTALWKVVERDYMRFLHTHTAEQQHVFVCLS